MADEQESAQRKAVMTQEINAQTANRLVDSVYIVDGFKAKQIFADKIYTELQLAEKRGEIRARHSDEMGKTFPDPLKCCPVWQDCAHVDGYLCEPKDCLIKQEAEEHEIRQCK